MRRPVIGITVDNRDNTATSGTYECAIGYCDAVADAGATPVLLPHAPGCVGAYVEMCDGLVLTGGVDPDTSGFGEPTHPRARPMDPRRQAFELAMLDAARGPVLGVCLGMQLMALRAGGRLDQYLPDHLATSDAHADGNRHPVTLERARDAWPPAGTAEPVVSSHRQAVADPGSMRVLARAPDGVIEAIDDPGRRFYVGVQWHPERGDDGTLNRGLFRLLARAALPAASSA